jgi:hypothetical protein
VIMAWRLGCHSSAVLILEEATSFDDYQSVTSPVIFRQDFRMNRILGGGAACFHPVHPEILSKKIKNPVQKK